MCSSMSDSYAFPGKALIISAPSGAGKTTLISYLRAHFSQLAFSVSACSRSPRPGEQDGKAYYFLSVTEFQRRIDRGDFIEWEEVYPGMFYGTLYDEVRSLWANGKVVLFDIDVKGALTLKQKFGSTALTIFIKPPSLEALRERLSLRATNTPDDVEQRIARAELELQHADRFDCVIINDVLEQAQQQILGIVSNFLASK